MMQPLCPADFCRTINWHTDCSEPYLPEPIAAEIEQSITCYIGEVVSCSALTVVASPQVRELKAHELFTRVGVSLPSSRIRKQKKQPINNDRMEVALALGEAYATLAIVLSRNLRNVEANQAYERAVTLIMAPSHMH